MVKGGDVGFTRGGAKAFGLSAGCKVVGRKRVRRLKLYQLHRHPGVFRYRTNGDKRLRPERLYRISDVHVLWPIKVITLSLLSSACL